MKKNCLHSLEQYKQRIEDRKNTNDYFFLYGIIHEIEEIEKCHPEWVKIIEKEKSCKVL